MDRISACPRSSIFDPGVLRGLHPSGDRARDRRTRPRQGPPGPHPRRPRSHGAKRAVGGDDRPRAWRARIRSAAGRGGGAHPGQSSDGRQASAHPATRVPLADDTAANRSAGCLVGDDLGDPPASEHRNRSAPIGDPRSCVGGRGPEVGDPPHPPQRPAVAKSSSGRHDHVHAAEDQASAPNHPVASFRSRAHSQSSARAARTAHGPGNTVVRSNR
jgi:hypothetical protein